MTINSALDWLNNQPKHAVTGDFISPDKAYRNTKAAILALTNLEAGMRAYATDYPLAPYGIYNGTTWDWFLTEAAISDTVYGAGWDADTTHAPSKNAVYDKINAIVSDTAYDATTWDGVTDVAPSKNAVRDKIESLATINGHAIKDEGGAALTQRANLNFVGTTVTATDDAGNNATVITITAATQDPDTSYLITEDLTAQVSGTTAHFDLTWEAMAKCHVYCNLRQQPADVTMDADMLGFTLSYTPTTADKLVVDYYLRDAESLFVYDENNDLVIDENGDYVITEV